MSTEKHLMWAAVLDHPGRPLAYRRIPVPEPKPGQLLVKVEACAVCRTDLHVVDGELPNPKLPVIPGHEVVGRVVAVGSTDLEEWIGRRVGVPWMGSVCRTCEFCQSGRENLCDQARFTGYTLDGGYAEYVTSDAYFSVPVPEQYAAAEAAPLLCAGLIGYRSYRTAGEGRLLGIYGFGAAAHIIAQVAVYEGRQVYAFTKPGDDTAQAFARSLGAVWAAGSDEPPPRPLDAAIIFAPVGALVPTALRAVKKGGTVVCGGIHMSDIPSFPYAWLWGERRIVSVANLTREDGLAFMEVAPRIPVRTSVQRYPLEKANQALEDLRHGRLTGAAVLIPPDGR